ncbi:hypothetical protein SLE2022_022680 [Rubroshorea leprosula]
MDKDGKYWSKAFIDPHSKCDSIDNNILETFNSWILKARCKAPISMNKQIIEMCMDRRRDKKFSVAKWSIDVSPRTRKKLKEHFDHANACGEIWNGVTQFQIYDGKTTFTHVIDFRDRTCTYRVWQCSGVPCAHALRAIINQGWNVDDYVHE